MSRYRNKQVDPTSFTMPYIPVEYDHVPGVKHVCDCFSAVEHLELSDSCKLEEKTNGVLEACILMWALFLQGHVRG